MVRAGEDVDLGGGNLYREEEVHTKLVASFSAGLDVVLLLDVEYTRRRVY